VSRILIAGIGNVFLGDDGFGVEVVRRLAQRALPADVRVADFGIRGLHLAYDLLDGGYQQVILVDATPREGAPGTVYLIEPDAEELGAGGNGMADAHAMTPQAVFSLLRSLGGTPGKVLVVGCEPQSVEEEMGLTPVVEAAVDEAVDLIRGLLAREARPSGGAGEEAMAPAANAPAAAAEAPR
jgi:hydrogenase maturation protease